MTSGAQAARDSAVRSSPPPTNVPEFTAEESLDELKTLATSAGAEIVGDFLQHRDRPDPATLIGSGKLAEIAAAVASVSADLVLFDHDLTASQQRNIEKIVEVRVIDRTQLILDIFAKHARTREGQLQVELAQLEYMLPRLAGRGVEMSQLGGGIGTRGPGETQLETDRRKIYRRVRHVKQQLENVRRIRGQQRQRRESVAGSDRRLGGLYQRWQVDVVQRAYQCRGAGIVANVRHARSHDTLRDAAVQAKCPAVRHGRIHPQSAAHAGFGVPRHAGRGTARRRWFSMCPTPATRFLTEQDAQVDKVLKELEADGKPRLRVKNKIDLLPAGEREVLQNNERTVYVSAAKGIGVDVLLEHIDHLLEDDRPSRVRLKVPQKEGKLLAMLEAKAIIVSRTYREGNVHLEIEAPESVLRGVKEFVK